MTSILKSLLKKFFVVLLLFLILSSLFIFLNRILIQKINSAIEERNNILKVISQSFKSQALVAKVNSKIKALEEKYKINFSEFKNNLLAQGNMPLQELQNKILNLAKENNLNLEVKESSPDLLKFSLIGGFNDLKHFEKLIKENKLRLKLESVRIFSRGNNYLFEIEAKVF